MKHHNKAFSSAFVCIAMLVAQSPSYAKLGSYHPPAAHSSSAPTVSHATAAPSRMGGGQSVGMQRPAVMQAARAPSLAPAQPMAQAPARPAVAAPNPATAGPGTPGWVKPALAGAAVGALAGYAMSNHGAPAQAAPQGYANNGYAPNAASQEQYPQGQAPSGGSSYSNPAMNAPAQSSSGMGFFGFLMLLGLLAGGFFLWRKFYKGETLQQTMDNLKPSHFSGNTAAATVTPPPSPVIGLDYLQQFQDLQQWNNAGNAEALQKVTTAELFGSLKPSIGTGQTSVLKVTGSIIDVTAEATRTVASVRFSAVISENGAAPESLEEVWHFVQERDTHAWLLAGIEQV